MKSTRIVKGSLNSQKEYSPTDPQVFFAKPRRPSKAIPLSDRIANSNICTKNFKWKEADIDFPNQPWMRHVDKYYPFAEGGPLLVDEPQLKHQLQTCDLKKELLRSHGYRYLVLTKESTLESAAEELQKWPGQTS